MAFRIDDISIHLMPSQDKNDKADKDKDKDKPKDQGSHGPHGQACTMATATQYTPQIQKTGGCPQTTDEVQALAFLQAQLREALAPPPLQPG
jgi:hypothetical protein